MTTEKFKVNIQLSSRDKCIVHAYFNQAPNAKQYTIIKDIIKNQFKGIWNPNFRTWEILRSDIREFIKKIRQLPFEVDVHEIPDYVNKALVSIKDDLKIYQRQNLIATIKYNYDDKKKTYQNLPKEFADLLYPYQKKCIEFGIRNHARILIADEMGIGKTVESLAIAYLYRITSWPLLIICPSCLKLNWKQEIVKWYRSFPDSPIHLNDILLVTHHLDRLKVGPKIIVMAYDMVGKYIQSLDNLNINFVICDEAHYLKNQRTKRAERLIPFLRKKKHLLLLTGTPALSKPKDLFNILHMLRPDIYRELKLFANRYCDPKPSKFHSGIDYDGASNIRELHFVLSQNLMIRRLKKDVLVDLPDKIRQKIDIFVEKGLADQINQKLVAYGYHNMEKLLNGMSSDKKDKIQTNLWNSFNECYKLTGRAKIKGICEYMATLFENNIKFLIYAHHIEVLNQIEKFVSDRQIKYIRVDGQTNMTKRHTLINDFQTKHQIKVGVFSLTSSSVGINLTAASEVIFAELHWTPGTMIQAEDRLHRIGQENKVHCHYLIGKGTLDAMMFSKLEEKFRLVSNIVDGKIKQYREKEVFKKKQSQPINHQQDTLLQINQNIQQKNNLPSLPEQIDLPQGDNRVKCTQNNPLTIQEIQHFLENYQQSQQAVTHDLNLPKEKTVQQTPNQQQQNIPVCREQNVPIQTISDYVKSLEKKQNKQEQDIFKQFKELDETFDADEIIDKRQFEQFKRAKHEKRMRQLQNKPQVIIVDDQYYADVPHKKVKAQLQQDRHHYLIGVQKFKNRLKVPPTQLKELPRQALYISLTAGKSFLIRN